MGDQDEEGEDENEDGESWCRYFGIGAYRGGGKDGDEGEDEESCCGYFGIGACRGGGR